MVLVDNCQLPALNIVLTSCLKLPEQTTDHPACKVLKCLGHCVTRLRIDAAFPFRQPRRISEPWNRITIRKTFLVRHDNLPVVRSMSVSYTHLRAHETVLD